jgi:hypothetical protein
MSFRLSAFSFLLSVIKVAVLFVTFLNFSYLASTLNLKNNPEKIFITEDLTKTRQFIVKELNTQNKSGGVICHISEFFVSGFDTGCAGFYMFF